MCLRLEFRATDWRRRAVHVFDPRGSYRVASTLPRNACHHVYVPEEHWQLMQQLLFYSDADLWQDVSELGSLPI